MAQTSAPRRHRMKAALWTFALAAPLIGVTNISPALAQAEQFVPGVWHYRSVECVDTTVVSVEPRLVAEGQKKFSAQDFESGVDVVFNTHLGSDPAHPHLFASVTHYGGLPGNEIMVRERPGDKVQVCFSRAPHRLSPAIPTKTKEAVSTGCTITVSARNTPGRIPSTTVEERELQDLFADRAA
jgi:hypothetical protein